MKNRLIEAILIIVVMASMVVGASVAIYNSQTTVTSSTQQAPQIGGYPAPEYGYPVVTPTDTITLPGYPVMPTPDKIPTGQPTPKDFTPAPKMTPTEPVPTKDMGV